MFLNIFWILLGIIYYNSHQKFLSSKNLVFSIILFVIIYQWTTTEGKKMNCMSKWEWCNLKFRRKYGKHAKIVISINLKNKRYYGKNFVLKTPKMNSLNRFKRKMFGISAKFVLLKIVVMDFWISNG